MALEQLEDAKIFMKLDLQSTYNLIRIQEGDEWKTVFTTSIHYEYLVMLTNAAGVFQTFVNDFIKDLLNYCVKKAIMVRGSSSGL